MRPVGVLFVDDDENVRSCLARMFRLETRPTWFASGPEQALELVRRHPDIGVVVSDQRMPGMTGLELIARLRERRPRLVPVLVTAHADTDVLSGAINGGSVFRFVPKPWDDERLFAVVRDAVAQYELVRENRRLRVLDRRRSRQLAALNRRLERTVAERTRYLAEANTRLREAALGIVRLLATTAEQGDPHLSGHGEQVAKLAVGLGRRLRVPAGELEDLRLAAMLLAIGRIGVPREVVDAAASGQREAGELLHAHVERAARLLEPLPFSRAVVGGVRHQAERWDGQGVPLGLRGTEIPLIARILGCADAYVRSLRAGGLAPRDAQEALIRAAGRAHDPDVVAALIEVEADSPRGASARQLAGARS